MAERAMSYYLGRAARRMRQENDVTQLDVATRAGVSEPTIVRFENIGGWRMRTNEIVAAYSVETGVAAADIWAAALELWRSA